MDDPDAERQERDQRERQGHPTKKECRNGGDEAERVVRPGSQIIGQGGRCGVVIERTRKEEAGDVEKDDADENVVQSRNPNRHWPDAGEDKADYRHAQEADGKR